MADRTGYLKLLRAELKANGGAWSQAVYDRVHKRHYRQIARKLKRPEHDDACGNRFSENEEDAFDTLFKVVRHSMGGTSRGAKKLRTHPLSELNSYSVVLDILDMQCGKGGLLRLIAVALKQMEKRTPLPDKPLAHG